MRWNERPSDGGGVYRPEHPPRRQQHRVLTPGMYREELGERGERGGVASAHAHACERPARHEEPERLGARGEKREERVHRERRREHPPPPDAVPRQAPRDATQQRAREHRGGQPALLRVRQPELVPGGWQD